MVAAIVLLLGLSEPSTAPRDGPAAPAGQGGVPTVGITPLEPDPRTPPPPPRGPTEPDRKTAYMVRWHLMFGPLMRVREVDPVLATGVEYGKMHGFSGAFHFTLIPPPTREPSQVVSVLETSLGVGPVLRGRLKRPVFGSIALTAGIRIHRAATDTGVVHRVDPDLRLPIQAAWTIRTIGLSVALVQGYSFRARAYESRGAVAWHRAAYRIGVLFGLHLDFSTRRPARRRRIR